MGAPACARRWREPRLTSDQVLEGATIAEVEEGRIVELREYETSAPLYDWTGTWRE